MMNDPIVHEVRRLRYEHAARFNYDLDAIFRDIKEQEKQSGRKLVSFAPRSVGPNTPPAGPAPAAPDNVPPQPPSATDAR